MTFPVNVGIPAANNAPADDQPIMQLNTQNLVNTIAVDHLSPNVAGSGKHKQVQFLTAAVAPGAQIDPASVIYPASLAGQASANVEAYYKNASGIFPMSAIKAFATFTIAGAVVTIQNQLNISTITFDGTQNRFLVTLVAGAVNGNFPTIILNTNMRIQSNYVWTLGSNLLQYIPGAQFNVNAIYSCLILEF